MAKSLASASDIKTTTESMDAGGQNYFLSIPDSKTPWFLLGLDYTSFFTHWYEGPQGRRSVVCAGGDKGKGFATDECPICEYVLELYQEGKRLREEEMDKDAGEKLKKKANDIRGKAQVLLKAVRGQYILVRDNNGQKHWEADFDMDPEDEESNVEVGILSLSQAQWDGLTGLINGENTPFITDGSDLGKHVLITRKEKKKGSKSKYTQVVWSAEEGEYDLPEIEIPEDLANLDLDEFAEINPEEVNKVAAYIMGQSTEDVAEDEAVETIDSNSTDLPDDSYLDDVPDEEDAMYDGEDGVPAEEAEMYADEDDVKQPPEGDPAPEEFEDDLPYESTESEPEQVPRTPVKAKSQVPRTPVKAKSQGTRTPVKAKSQAPRKQVPVRHSGKVKL